MYCLTESLSSAHGVQGLQGAQGAGSAARAPWLVFGPLAAVAPHTAAHTAALTARRTGARQGQTVPLAVLFTEEANINDHCQHFLYAMFKN